MATLTIRKVDPEVQKRLRVRAAENGRSMEAELRQIIKDAVGGATGAEKQEEESGAEPRRSDSAAFCTLWRRRRPRSAATRAHG